MEPTRRNLAVFAALLIPFFLAAFYAHTSWFRLFINDRTFSVTFGWIYWPMLLSWIPDAVIFAISGLALAIFLRVDKLGYWALGFGGLYSLIGIVMSFYTFLMSPYTFEGTARLLDYVWAYGGHLVPPLSCALAAVYARHHGEQRLRNPGPYA
jgi:hypothetical protein